MAFSPVPGIRIGSTAAGIRYARRDDLVIVEAAAGSVSAASFTRNRFCAAPVIVAREHLAAAAPRFLVINAGNANAGTGERGIRAARRCCAAVAARGGCLPHEVLPFSTGVIGQHLPVERIEAAVAGAFTDLAPIGWRRASRAIMTTDTVPKLVSVPFKAAGRDYVVTGMAKGAGMICPDMATMLAFVATDAPLSPDETQRCLRDAVDQSFNRISVDGDTSTNDAAVLIATGAGGGARGGEVPAAAGKAVAAACVELAKGIVRDAEGAGKFVTIEVTGGAAEADCLAVAYTIAHSPLVKTALSASDPNWGRIVAAVGRSPVAGLDMSRVSVFLGDARVFAAGELDANYTEEQGVAVLGKPDIVLRVELGMGSARAAVWTCDLSAEYVRINAEYRS